MGQLYKIDFKTSGKSYIGISSVSARDRWNSHIKGCNSSIVSKALKKYGIFDATLIILAEESDWATLCEMEVKAIKDLKTKAPLGYNCTNGGEGVNGLNHTEERKARISAFFVGNKYNIGRKLSDETKAKLSAINKGKKLSDSAKSKISVAQKGKKLSDETKAKLRDINLGNAISNETKLKISNALKGRVKSAEHQEKITSSLKIIKKSEIEKERLRKMNIGRKHTEAAKANMTESKKGRKVSEETRIKISNSHKGFRLSTETRAKISATKKLKQKVIE